MVLQALEFSDCLLDSPHFRERLNAHEKELDNTSKVIKKLIQEGKDLINAAKNYARCQRTFAQTLIDFKFETIGSQQTDEEIIISKSLRSFGELIQSIEDSRDIMMERVKETFVDKLEEFRKSHIVTAKDERKRFEKTTKTFCAAMDKHLAIKPAKLDEGQIKDSDQGIDDEKRTFHKQAMAYVMKLQEVHERKKFEFVETLLAFMYGWKTFYHQGYETGQEMEPYMRDLGIKLNKTRENFESTRDEASQLMNKMLEEFSGHGHHHHHHHRHGVTPLVTFAAFSAVPLVKKQTSESSAAKMFTRQGYLYAMEKKALGTISWNKYFCSYQKEAKIFTMIPFNQTTSNAGKLNLTPDTMVLSSCIRRATETIDRRFCFDITIQDRANPMTLQALSDPDRHEWLEAMDGKEPVYAQPVISKDSQEYYINEVGFTFVSKCINAVESRGITDTGLYRVVGVSSKVNRLMLQAVDPKKIDKLNLSDPACEFEVKTITSALKNYFRKLSEPLMTFRLHQKVITAAKLENMDQRIQEIGNVVHQLPSDNYKMLSSLIKHLKNVAEEHEQNKMNISNLSVCFGPTLLRPEEETVAAIMDIKFCNVVVEILIENYSMIFEQGSRATTTNGIAPSADKLSSSSGGVQLRAVNNNKPAVPLKTYSEESTYGKHRPNYRANSVYANVPLATSPTRPDCPPPRPEHTPDRANSGNNNNNTVGSSAAQGQGQSAPNQQTSTALHQSKLFHSPAGGALKPDLYASRSPNSGRAGGRVQSALVTSEYNNKPPSYVNAHLKPSSTQLGAAAVADADPYRMMSKSYSGTHPNSQPPFPPNSAQGGLSHSHGPGTLTKLLRGVTRSRSRSKSRYLKSSVPGPGAPLINRRVRTLYACEAENDSELSFEPNEIIYNVRESMEPGWLEGTLNGKTGLMPANYIEYIN